MWCGGPGGRDVGRRWWRRCSDCVAEKVELVGAAGAGLGHCSSGWRCGSDCNVVWAAVLGAGHGTVIQRHGWQRLLCQRRHSVNLSLPLGGRGVDDEEELVKLAWMGWRMWLSLQQREDRRWRGGGMQGGGGLRTLCTTATRCKSRAARAVSLARPHEYSLGWALPACCHGAVGLLQEFWDWSLHPPGAGQATGLGE